MRFGARTLDGNGIMKAAVAAALALGMGFAADFGVNGDGSNASVILEGKNINPTSADKIGVQGFSQPAGNWGIGVKGFGGYRGVEGRIDASVPGNVGVGDRAALYGAAYNGATNYGVKAFAIGGTGTNYAVWGSASGTNSRAGYFSGDLEYTGALVHTSDRKLKKNIVDIRNCTNVLKRMAPKEFEYRSDEFPDLHLPKTHQAGLIAQDVEAVLPELVRESQMPASGETDKGAEAAKGKPETYKTVDYMGLIPYLVGAIQEQAYEIDALKKKIGGAK